MKILNVDHLFTIEGKKINIVKIIPLLFIYKLNRTFCEI